MVSFGASEIFGFVVFQFILLVLASKSRHWFLQRIKGCLAPQPPCIRRRLGKRDRSVNGRVGGLCYPLHVRVELRAVR